MIAISSPSAVLNDLRAPRAYAMDHTHPVTAGTSVRQAVDLILHDLRSLPAGRLQNLVLNGHGYPGGLQLGTGLAVSTMGPFADLRGRVHKIWFTGCLVARIIGPRTAADGDSAALTAYGMTTGNGHEFVSAFARLTGCYVVAPTEMQSSASTSLPRGCLDTYEGLLLCYDPTGTISWRHAYPSLYGHDTAARTAINPNNE